MSALNGRTLFITGASRGIGRAIALRCAKDGANIAIVAKTAEPHPKLEGTIFTVAKEIEQAGGKALPLAVDVRDDVAIQEAARKTAETFGGIDILVNNASAISLTPTLETQMKRFDLMFGVNVRATFAASQACLPYLLKGKNPHILTLSPPLNMQAKWFKNHLAYTMSKYGMSMCTLGLSAEFANVGVAANSLWPKTVIATAAIKNNFPAEIYAAARKPEIVADAAYIILTSDSRTTTGNFFVDEEVLVKAGITDLAQYAIDPKQKTYKDFFLD